MKVKDLTATLACLRLVLADPRLDDARREKLLKGKRELEGVQRSGKLNRSKVFRATRLIASTFAEVLADSAVPSDPETSAAVRRAR